MADNYLEKKMEEHRRNGMVKPLVRRLPPSCERHDMVSLKIDELRVFVTDGCSDTGSMIVRRLREAGCKVAFAGDDDKKGAALAQTSGARFYPQTFRASIVGDITKTWGGVDMIVITNGDMRYADSAKSLIIIGAYPCDALNANVRVNAIDPAGLSDANVAHLCLLLCLRGSECLRGVTLGAF